MSTEVRYQFFISSTYIDLEQERKKVSDLILELNHIPAGMELFSADNEEQWDTIQRVILNSDFYILIIGERYGSTESTSGISYTEKEYNFALENKIPILAFLTDNNYFVSQDKSPRESEEKYQKLKNFKDNVKSSRMIQYWSNKDDLALRISGAIVKAIAKYNRPGWIRGNTANSELKDKLLHYMEENKNLKEELEKYKSEKDNNGLDLFIKNEHYSFNINPDKIEPIIINVPISKLKVNINSEEVGFLSESDVPDYLTGYVTSDEIDEYNKKVPQYRQQLDEYKNELEEYRTSIIFSNFKITINNKKTKKLNNITIIIKFPNLFNVKKNQEILSEPKRPSIPNLLADVKIRHHYPALNSIRNQTGIFSAFKNIQPASLNEYLSPRMLTSPLLKTISFHESIDVENNNIEVYAKYVRQDTAQKIEDDDNLIIYPVKEGNSEIIIEILCDEYPKWKKINIPVTITFN